MTVSLLEIFAAARAHAAPLAAESAGYLLLAVADHVAVAPREVRADEVELGSDGSVRLRAARARGVAFEGAEQALRRLLERALEVSSSVGPGLRRAAARREAAGLEQLVRELETALIPVNRSAARRALARLYRETERARGQGKLAKWLVDEDAASAAALPVEAPAVVAPALPPSVAAVAAPAVVAPAAAVVAAIATPVALEPAQAFVEAVELVEAPSSAQAFVEAVELVEAPSPTPARTLPVVVAEPPLLTLSPPMPAAAEAELTPEPLIAQGEPAVTKPEPVVERAKARGNRTPRLGTVVTAQTLPGDESDLTERAPAVLAEDEIHDEDADLDLDLDIVVELEEPAAAAAPQPWLDPEPSSMPDVVTAMVALHTGVEADEAPTRLREEVVTAPRQLTTPPRDVAMPPREVPLVTPQPEQVDDAWLTQSSLEDVVTEHADRAAPQVVAAVEASVVLDEAEPVASDPLLVEVAPSAEASAALDDIVTQTRPFVSELADPVVHEAVTWDPGPVVTSARSPLPPALLIAEPPPEPSPYAPAVLPGSSSDVSELADSFHVSDAAEERELRGALKEMAGLELTPMPHPSGRIP